MSIDKARYPQIAEKICEEWSRETIEPENLIYQVCLVCSVLIPRPTEKLFRSLLEKAGIDLSVNETLARELVTLFSGLGFIFLTNRYENTLVDINNFRYAEGMLDDQYTEIKLKIQEDIKGLESLAEIM